MPTPITHLAVDLDNTLIDTLTACLACFNRLTGRQMGRDHCTRYEFYELYDWDEAEYLRAYAAHGHDIHRHAEPYPEALPVLARLAEELRITIITARPIAYAAITLEWLARHRVPYHAISFSHDKLRSCQAMDVDLLIDDTPRYAEAFRQQGRPFLLMDHPYNRDLPDDPLIRRVRSWNDVYRRLGE